MATVNIPENPVFGHVVFEICERTTFYVPLGSKVNIHTIVYELLIWRRM